MINTITLNPAIDHILYLDAYNRNITNRLMDTAVTMGGKGTHVSMDLAVMGEPSRAYGFGYGRNGRLIVEMLEAQGIVPRFVYDECFGENRDNYLIVERKTCDATLIADRGPVPTKDHVSALYEMIQKDADDGGFYALSGDASNFTDPYAYNKLMDILGSKKAKIFLDASGETLLSAVKQSPFLIKPNQTEMSLLVGKSPHSLPEMIDAIRFIDRSYQIYAIVISLGGDGSLSRIGDRLYRVKAPTVDAYNTVGCGDCMLAGMLYGFKHNHDPEYILRFATACSAAAAESPLSVGFNYQRAKELMEQVDVTIQ